MARLTNGGIFGKRAVQPSFLSAPGKWNISDQNNYMNSNSWASTSFNNMIGASTLRLALPLGGVYGLNDYSNLINPSNAQEQTFAARGASMSLDTAKFYETSLYMGTFAARNFVAVPNDSSLWLTNQDFTIEGWFYFTQNNVGYQALASHSSENGDIQSGWLITLESNNTLAFYATASAGTWSIAAASSYVPPTGQWIHVAVSRSSNTTRLFANGTQVGSSTAVANIISPVSRELRLGNYLFFPGGERGLSGYIQDFKIHIGSGAALYTTNFTPPTSGIMGPSPSNLGMSSSNPVSSISQLRASGVTADGTYWFSTSQNPTPFRAFCKFNYIDGGDWILALKVHNRGDMPSGSTFWTNTTTNNVSDFNLYGSSTFSKYDSWNGIRFTRLMMDMGGRIPPIMIFNTPRTMAEAISAAGTPSNGSGLAASYTDPQFSIGTGHDYSSSTQFPMRYGVNFSRQSSGQEGNIQRYGIGSWANNSSNSTTSVDGLASTGRAGAWIGAPLDEGTHLFNAVSNTGSDSGFGFGATAGNTARTTSCGYIEWASGSISDTLPAFVWIR